MINKQTILNIQFLYDFGIINTYTRGNVAQCRRRYGLIKCIFCPCFEAMGILKLMGFEDKEKMQCIIVKLKEDKI